MQREILFREYNEHRDQKHNGKQLGILLSRRLKDIPSVDQKQLGSHSTEDENVDSSESKEKLQAKDGCNRMHGDVTSDTDRITGEKNAIQETVLTAYLNTKK